MCSFICIIYLYGYIYMCKYLYIYIGNPSKIIDELRQRFRLDLNNKEAAEFVHTLIENATGMYIRTYVRVYIHTYIHTSKVVYTYIHILSIYPNKYGKEYICIYNLVHAFIFINIYR
jgi:hypothetical protein